MRFIDFFAGIGGFRLGMELAGHKCVGHCEIDKFADKSYRAMHKVKEGEWYADDICRVEPRELPEADIWTGGFPCQAFSIAGKRQGFQDMRGTLIFEIFRLAAERKPKILFLENVAGLLNHEGGRTFGIILDGLWELGYDVQWQVLNSKNFGVPQNRERVFVVGHLGKGSRREIFPIHGTDGKDIKQLGNIDQHKRKRENPQTGRVYDPNGISPCLSTMQGGGLEPKVLLIGKDGKRKNKDYASCLTGGGHSGGNHSDMDLLVQADISYDGIYTDASKDFRRPPLKNLSRTIKANNHDAGVVITEATKKGYAVANEGDSINFEQPNSKTRRGRVGKGIAQTLTTSPQQATIQNCKIRRLTPRECFRLQGFPDEHFDRAREVNSDSQLYKQAGNSVTVNVIHEIAKRF